MMSKNYLIPSSKNPLTFHFSQNDVRFDSEKPDSENSTIKNKVNAV